MLGSEERFCSVDRQRLHNVDIFATAVVALARISLGILVREHTANRAQYRGGNEVFGCDELDAKSLTLFFLSDRAGDLGVRCQNVDRGSNHERLSIADSVNTEAVKSARIVPSSNSAPILGRMPANPDEGGTMRVFVTGGAGYIGSVG